ncbi:MAG: hypothetical protein ABSA58_18060 [Acetobacteraceae bacterium]
MDRRLFLATALLVGSTAVAAIAQTAPPTRVRGTIAALDGNNLTVNSRDGQKLAIVLKDPVTVATVKKVELSAIEPNSFIGTATRTGADGKLTAIEVLVFPEAMRGTGEGFYPWDLEPGSMMTNGTVKGAVTAASGRELTIGFKDSSNTVYVPPTAPIVTFAPATRDDLKLGAPVFLIAMKNADGTLAAARVTVGKDGVAPPM